MCATAGRAAKCTTAETIALLRVDWECDLLKRKLIAQWKKNACF